MAFSASGGWTRHFSARKTLFYVFFWGFHCFLFGFGMYKQITDKRLAGVNVLTYSIWISRGAGLVLSVDGTMVLLPVCRTLLRWLRPKIRIIPMDESTWFHRQVAYAMLVFTIVHTTGHYVNFFNIEKDQVRPQTAIKIHYTQPGGITGHIMLLCMLLMYTTAHHKIRQQAFESFWYTHHLFVPFFLGLYTHATGCFVRDTTAPFSPFAGEQFWKHCLGYHGWRWELWAGGIYLLERLYRELRARRETEIVRVVRHPYDVVEIQFRKPSMRYRPGQWLFLNVPEVSYYQWHPFTITSCPFDDNISVHIRQVGDFTKTLADAVGAGHMQAKMSADMNPMAIYEIALQQGQKMPKLRIDGPYGAPAEDIFDNEISVIIGAGIGVTPWASILKNIWHLRKNNKPMRLRSVEFIWICGDTRSFEWFQALLASLEAQLGGIDLRIQIYLTQRVDTDTASNIMLNSVGSNEDPLTKLKARTNFGRPNFSKTLCGIREKILDGTYLEGSERSLKTEVGVYFCGPAVAARSIRSACKVAICPEVNFKFWKEHF
ncbi:putative NADPH oxidase [Leptodontidium sp. 2 PMI_412]|nr:putative NADPH oxidase [Leptodontidium sp. 2 PMI_412]